MKVKITSPTLNEVNELDLTLATTQKGECVIGRSPDCDLPLEDADVSRIHGKFFVQGGNYYFCDLGSRNGSIINNKLAEKNLPYLLKDGDSIQIGDYVLILEGITPISEQLPETVFRVIDPSLFSGRQAFENLTPANTSNPASEVAREFTEEVISQNQEEVEASELVYADSSEDNEVITASENPIAEERTFVQPQDIASQPPEIVSDITSNDSDEYLDLSTPVSQEFTIVQPRDLLFQPSPSTSVIPTTDSDDAVDLDTANSDEVETLEVVSEVYPEANTNIDVVTEDTSSEISDNFSPAPELVNDLDAEADEVVPEALNESQAEVIIAPENNIQAFAEVTEVFSNEYVDFSSRSPEEVSEEPTTADVFFTAKALEIEEFFSTEQASEEPTTADIFSTAESLEIEESISTEEVSEEPTTADAFSTAESLEIEESISTEEVSEEP
ncbi:FHA domain-containing protein, partial [Nodularia sphaerocarpa]